MQKSTKIYEPLTKLQCCPTSDGAACAIVCSEEFVKAHGLEDQAVEIKAIAMTTDSKSTFDSNSSMNLVGSEMARRCAEKVYKKAGIAFEDVPSKVDVALGDDFGQAS